jgi:hypothetical protein
MTVALLGERVEVDRTIDGGEQRYHFFFARRKYAGTFNVFLIHILVRILLTIAHCAHSGFQFPSSPFPLNHLRFALRSSSPRHLSFLFFIRLNLKQAKLTRHEVLMRFRLSFLAALAILGHTNELGLDYMLDIESPTASFGFVPGVVETFVERDCLRAHFVWKGDEESLPVKFG